MSLISCGSHRLAPPSTEAINSFKEQIKQNNFTLAPLSSTEESWARDYLFAHALKKTNRSASCSLFNKLSKEEHFPLQSSALIESIEVCSFGKDELLTILSKALIPKWNEEKFLRNAQIATQRLGSLSHYAEYTFRLAKFQKLQQDQENYILLAIRLAEQNKDQDSLTKYQRELFRISPRLNVENKLTKTTGRELYNLKFDQGKDLEKNRKFGEARNLYEELVQELNGGDKLQLKALQKIIFNYKKERDIEKYLLARKRFSQHFKNLYDKNPRKHYWYKLWLHASIRYARAVWSNIGVVEARPLLLELLNEEINSNGLYAWIHWLIGNTYLEEKNMDKALEYFSIANKYCRREKQLCQNITWSLGWNLYLQKKYNQASEVFSSFTNPSKFSSENLRFIFWYAKSLKKAQDLGRAEDIFEKIIEIDPFSYYGFLSKRELNHEIDPFENAPNLEVIQIDELDWIMALEGPELASRFLESISKTIKSDEERQKLIPLFYKLGSFSNVLIEFQKLSSAFRKDHYLKNIFYIYPQSFQNLVLAGAKKFNINPYLLYSIMRQESAFNPLARSPADAFGLMQITPEGASIISKKYRLPYGNTNELFDPQINIPIGAAFFMELFSQHKNRFISGVAAYNAGSIPVRRWEKDRFELSCFTGNCTEGSFFEESIKFIEMIPYEETRNYVKLVFRNILHYYALNAKDSFTLPEGLFENVNSLK